MDIKELERDLGLRFSAVFWDISIHRVPDGRLGPNGKPYWPFSIFYRPLTKNDQYVVVGNTFEEALMRLEENSSSACQYEEQ
jgi:hypothetical protein